jgi:NADH-quinone oxidoreductase subunit L
VFLGALALVAGFVVFNGVGKAIGFPGGITEFVFGSEGPERYHINWSVAGGSLILAGSGIFFGAWIYWNGSLARSTRLAEWNPGLYALIQRKFYFDDLYQAMIDRGVLGFSYVVSWFDRYVVNDTGVDGTAQVTGYGGYLLKFLQSGKLPNYALGIAVGVVGLAFAGLLMRA